MTRVPIPQTIVDEAGRCGARRAEGSGRLPCCITSSACMHVSSHSSSCCPRCLPAWPWFHLPGSHASPFHVPETGQRERHLGTADPCGMLDLLKGMDAALSVTTKGESSPTPALYDGCISNTGSARHHQRSTYSYLLTSPGTTW